MTTDDHHHADTNYVPGKMDIRAQERTFDGFVKMCVWASVICLLVLGFVALANG